MTESIERPCLKSLLGKASAGPGLAGSDQRQTLPAPLVRLWRETTRGNKRGKAWRKESGSGQVSHSRG